MLPTPKANAHLSRFLSNRRRKSCVFVNPNEDEVVQLKASASQLQLVLTQYEEENIGSVVRLVRAPGAMELPPSSLRDELSSRQQSVKVDVTSYASDGLKRPPELQIQQASLPDCECPSAEWTPVPSPVRRPSDRSFSLSRLVSFTMQAVVNLAQQSLSSSSERPQLTEDGTGGVYFIRRTSGEARDKDSSRSEASGRSDTLAVFKPSVRPHAHDAC